MSNTCDIIAKRRLDRNKVVDSLLHSDLLGLGKIVKSFNRWKANKAFYLSLSKKFLSDHLDTLIFDKEENGEPSLISLYETVESIERNRLSTINREAAEIFTGVTYGHMRDYLAKKFLEGVYSYQEAKDKMISFNKEYKGSHTFMGTISPTEDGNYEFSIVYNTEENQLKLILSIAEKEAADAILKLLEKSGVGAQDAKVSSYNSLSPKTLLNGLTGLLLILQGVKRLESIGKETGHFIIESLSDTHPLKLRLYKIISSLAEAFRDLLGEEEFDRYYVDGVLEQSKKNDELVGHLVGLYLELTAQLNNSRFAAFTALVLRAIDYVKSRFTFTDRLLKIAKYEAKWAAFNLAKDFMGDNFKGTLENALSNKKILEGFRRETLNAFTARVKEFQLSVEKMKDVHFKIYKEYKDTFKKMASAVNDLNILFEERERERTAALERGEEAPGNVFTDLNVEETLLELYLLYTIFLSNELTRALTLLLLSFEGVNSEGEPISLQEHAKIIKYNELVYDLATTIIKLSDGILTENVITNDLLKLSLQQLFEVLDSLLNGKIINDSGERSHLSRYSHAIIECRKMLASKLLVLINGSSFLSIDNYVSVNNLKVIRHAPKVLNVLDELQQTDINPWGSFISRWIDSIADNPDIIDLMIYDIVEELKHKANIKTLEIKERLFLMYQDFQKIEWIDAQGKKHIGGNTEVFFERFMIALEGDPGDNKFGNLTGNLISERNWGEWERDLKEDLKLWEDAQYEKTITYNVKMYNPDTMEYESKSFTYGDIIVRAVKDKHGIYHHKEYGLPNNASKEELKAYNEAYYKFLKLTPKTIVSRKFVTKSSMFNDPRFLIDLGAFKQKWHEEHSVKVDTGEVSEDGKPIKIWKPALLSDMKNAAYDNRLYDFLTLDENSALLSWYNEYLALKKELDRILPEGCTNRDGVRAPQFMGTVTNRLKNAVSGENSGKAFGLTIAQHVLYGIMDSPDDYEFGGEHNTYDESDLKDSNGLLIYDRALMNALLHTERIPIYGVKKLRNLNHLSTDLFQSTLAYASMAHNYEALQEYVGAIEAVAGSMKERKVDNTLTIDKLIDRDKPLSYNRLQDYIRQLVYNDYSSKNTSKTRRALRKVTGKISGLASFWFLGGNLHSASVNALTGMWEILKEACGESDFTRMLFVRAWGIFIAHWVPWKVYPVLKELCPSFISREYMASIQESHDKLALFLKRYNFLVSNERHNKDWHIQSMGYGLTKGRSIMDFLMLPYEITDEWMQSIAYIASALNTELTLKKSDPDLPTKKVNLWELWTVKGNELVCINDTMLTDWTIYDKEVARTKELLLKKKMLVEALSSQEEEYLLRDENVTYDLTLDNKFRLRARGVNNRLHGVYNSLDGGALLAMILGPAAVLMKKYAIGLADRRFSRARYDYRKKKMRQGTSITLIDVAYDLIINPNPEGVQQISVADDASKLEKWAVAKNNKWEQTVGIRQAYGLGLFAYLILLSLGHIYAAPVGTLLRGCPARHEILRRRGYSDEQICNFDKAIADCVTIIVKNFVLSYIAPPDDEELSEMDFDTEYDNIWAGGKLLRYLFENFLLLSPGDKTVNDEEMLDMRELSRKVWESDHVIPFSLTSILYYLSYRTLKELYAFHIFGDWRHGPVLEYKSLLSTALPGVEGTVSIVNTLSYALALMGVDNSKKETLEEWAKLQEDEFAKKEDFKKWDYYYFEDDQIQSGEKGLGMEVYTRGENKLWYKYAMTFLKSSPILKSFMIGFNSARAAQNMEYSTLSTVLKDVLEDTLEIKDYWNDFFSDEGEEEEDN